MSTQFKVIWTIYNLTPSLSNLSSFCISIIRISSISVLATPHFFLALVLCLRKVEQTLANPSSFLQSYLRPHFL